MGDVYKETCPELKSVVLEARFVHAVLFRLFLDICDIFGDRCSFLTTLY